MVAEQIRTIRTHIPEGLTLVCVSKFHPVEAIREAYEAGERHFGESRVQELQEKVPALPSDICWHFIGHLQTNKVRDLLKLRPYLIESVDSLRLLKALNDEAAKQGYVQDILLELHVAREETKTGFTPEEITSLFANRLQDEYTHIRVRGLMTMATNTDDETEIRRCFLTAQSLYDRLKANSQQLIAVLSMGMSDDYRIAIECGSTSVRIGSAIFGERSQTFSSDLPTPTPMPTPMPKAFFFDMDGTLFNSMPVHAVAWKETMRKHGLEFDEQATYINEGRTGEDVISEAFNMKGEQASLEEIKAIYHEKTEAFRRMCPNGAEPVEGVPELLALLQSRGVECWIVTGSGQQSLLNQLNRSFPGVFTRERMITALDVTHGKPDPEPYLKAWERSGYSKDECCVVENAPLGVRSGKAAGLFTIAVNTGPLPDELLAAEGADLIFPNMHELIRKLKITAQ